MGRDSSGSDAGAPIPAAPVSGPNVTVAATPGARATQRVSRPSQSPDCGEGNDDTAEWRFDEALSERQTEGEDSHVIGGRYRILEGVAMGGMGAVFKVRHLSLGKEFALKIIHQAMSSNSQMLKFFSREAQVLSRLDHPAIVRITDFGHDERFGAYLVMEYLDGESLHARLTREKRLALGPALTVGLQIAEALHHMHSAELIHCDIKPENIFLVRQQDGSRQRILAKVIDFGLSKSMAAGARLDASEIGGTPIYAAPEQIEGLAPQPSMDIYAMGELLYHMLTGTPPFTGSTPEICTQKLTGTPPTASSQLDEELDENLEALIMKTLQRRPDARPSSMAQVVFELRTVMDMLQVRTPRRARGGDPQSLPRVPTAHAPQQAIACDGCPLPVFRTDAEATLTSVNPAFARLLRESADSLPGTRLGSTRLGNVYSQIDQDLRDTCAAGTPQQRLVTFGGRGGQQTTLLLWLVPQPSEGDQSAGLWGMVVPLQEGLI